MWNGLACVRTFDPCQIVAMSDQLVDRLSIALVVAAHLLVARQLILVQTQCWLARHLPRLLHVAAQQFMRLLINLQ